MQTFNPQLPMDSAAMFMWLLLHKTAQTVPEGSDGA